MGDYVLEIAPRPAPADPVRSMIDSIGQTLERFRVQIDNWAFQSEMEERLPTLLEKLDTYTADGALYVRSTALGDEKDRVLVRSPERGGTPTYEAADLAYLADKLERGFERAIYVLGADHHGVREWFRVAARLLGDDPDKVEVILYQLVHILEGGRTQEDVQAPRRHRPPRRADRADRAGCRALVPRLARPRPDDRARRRSGRRALAEEPRLLRPVRPRPHLEHPRQGRRARGERRRRPPSSRTRRRA